MRGFTLIELIIVLVVLAIVSVLAIPFIQSFQVSSDLYTYTDTVTQTLRRAQQQALVGQNSSAWGVYFDTGNRQFILFKGENFSARDQDYDQKFDYPQIFSLNTNFGDEIYFSLYSGQPSVSGSVTINDANNNTKTILIDDYGKIQTSN